LLDKAPSVSLISIDSELLFVFRVLEGGLVLLMDGAGVLKFSVIDELHEDRQKIGKIRKNSNIGNY